MQRIDAEHCANLAQFSIQQTKMDLEEIFEAIHKKSEETTEAAILELQPLCEEYMELSRKYEHLISLELLNGRLKEKK
jgi:hypothetical protein